MNEPRASRRAFLASAPLLIAPCAFAQADDWPSKQIIRMIVPGPPGGAMDTYARIIQPGLQNALKQNIIIDFKPGANMIIGLDAAAKAKPDGYTIVMAPSSGVAINPIILPKMPFDVRKDLVPVAQIGAGGTVLVANPSTGWKNLNDMVAWAKANPGQLSYATWGSGSTGHLVMEGIKARYGLNMVHVPYKTTAQAIADIMANHMKVGFTDIASPVPHIRSGKLVALGISGSARGPALPSVPTLSEQGFKFDSDGWFGIFVPAGTPPAIVTRLNQEIGKILASEEVRQKFTQQNMVLPPYKSPEQFAATVRTDIDKWQALAKEADLKVD